MSILPPLTKLQITKSGLIISTSAFFSKSPAVTGPSVSLNNLKVLTSSVWFFTNETPVPHNGCRPPKRPRN